MKRRRLKKQKFLTLTSSGKRKRMPKFMVVSGKRFRVYPEGWMFLQQKELVHVQR